MSRIPSWHMIVGVWCTICDRQTEVCMAEGDDLPGLLAKQGCCVVGPNLNGILLVEGCVWCMRYTTLLPNPRMREKGGDQ